MKDEIKKKKEKDEIIEEIDKIIVPKLKIRTYINMKASYVNKTEQTVGTFIKVSQEKSKNYTKQK